MSGSLGIYGDAARRGGTGADYGRYWITAAGLEYLAAVDRAHVADADADEDLDLVDAAAADDDDHGDAPAPAAAPARVHAARAARLSKELGTAGAGLAGAMAASTSSSHVWKVARRNAKTVAACDARRDRRGSSPSAADGEKPAYIFNLVASLFFSTFALIALLPTLPPVPMAQQAPKTRQAERAALVRTLLDKKGIQ
ncbi:hypothetical protein JL722_4034 [Aureococcus anophagefferens]|nr:hypothetical protein JL722_4034 [Aureococcus anophagefferens]